MSYFNDGKGYIYDFSIDIACNTKDFHCVYWYALQHIHTHNTFSAIVTTLKESPIACCVVVFRRVPRRRDPMKDIWTGRRVSLLSPHVVATAGRQVMLERLLSCPCFLPPLVCNLSVLSGKREGGVG